jgi:hypothetical protein
VEKIPVGFPHQVKFIQCSDCGGIVGVEGVHNRVAQKNHERIDQVQKPVYTSSSGQSALLPDINTILKRLYG